MKASREERIKVKNKLEEEKDSIYDILQKVKDGKNVFDNRASLKLVSNPAAICFQGALFPQRSWGKKYYIPFLNFAKEVWK